MIFVQPPLGSLVDRIGAKQVLVVGIGTSAGAMFLLGLAPGYGALLVGALLMGVGQSTFHPANYPLLDAAASAEVQGKCFGIHMFAGYVGFALAPIVVGALALQWGWRVALLVLGGVGLLVGIGTSLRLETIYLTQLESTSDRNSRGPKGSHWLQAAVRTVRADLAVLTERSVLSLFLLFSLLGMLITGIMSFTPLFAIKGFGFEEQIGNGALTAYMTLATVGILIGGWGSDAIDTRWVIGGALAFGAAGLAVIVGEWGPITPSIFIGLFALVGLFYGAALPARDALVNAKSTSDTTGRAFGITSTGVALGGVLAPSFLGYVIDRFDVGVAFWIIVVFFIAASVLAVGIEVLE